MTATSRRRWQPEEKLAIIKEIQEKGAVVETCRKYTVDPTMYYTSISLNAHYFCAIRSCKKGKLTNRSANINDSLTSFWFEPLQGFWFRYARVISEILTMCPHKKSQSVLALYNDVGVQISSHRDESFPSEKIMIAGPQVALIQQDLVTKPVSP